MNNIGKFALVMHAINKGMRCVDRNCSAEFQANEIVKIVDYNENGLGHYSIESLDGTRYSGGISEGMHIIIGTKQEVLTILYGKD